MPASFPDREGARAWFRGAGWGCFFHFLSHRAVMPGQAPPDAGLDPDGWNRKVDAFDVERVAAQLAEAGAAYAFLTLGQNSGYYCAPNSAYDAVVGGAPSRLSRRDLVADLAAALARRGLRLGVYLVSNGPEDHALAVERLGWTRGPHRNAEFQRHWEAVIRCWSERWGDRVFAWWIDHVVHPDALYRHPEPPNFASFAAALRAGNPAALLAFNPGCRTQVAPVAPEEEDFSAGEMDYFLALCGRRPPDGKGFNLPERLGGKVVHLLGFLGEWWGQGAPRFPDALARGYTEHVNAHGGVVSWDVPCGGGDIPAAFLRQLSGLPRRPAEI